VEALTQGARPMPRLYSSTMVGALALACGTVALLWIIPSQIRISAGQAGELSPALFPVALSWSLIASGAFLLLPLLRRSEPASNPPPPRSARRLLPAAALIIAIALAIACMQALGYLVTMTALGALTIWTFGERRPSRMAGGAVITAAVTWLLFQYGLGMRLPSGWLLSIGT
jgi:putative tricarboxylic transport membrane protein